MIAVLQAHRKGLFGPGHRLRNVISGLIVGIVALPLAMAFAIASGAKPEQGLYTAIIAGFIVSVFGGSKLQIAGPTGAFVVILSGITAKYGIDGLQIATVIAGIMLALLGLARLGGIIKFIPGPVIVGFTAGIGVVIWVGQWQYFFGIPAPAGTHFHEKLIQLVSHMPQLSIETTGLALLSLVLILVTPRIPGLRSIPGTLVAMIVATVIQAVFKLPGVATIESAFGGIPQSLPTFAIPTITLPKVIELIKPAFTIAMLGAIESLLSAVVADGMAGTRHDSNQELIGQGAANIIVPFFGGFAATGAIARTATNIRNGGTSPLSGIVHCVTLVLVILFFAPLAGNIPLCALASILFIVAYNMSEIPHFLHIVKHAPRRDIFILLMSFGLTVFVDLIVAVYIGVIVAALLFMQRMSSVVEVQEHDDSSLSAELLELGYDKLPQDVLVFSIEGPFFFAATDRFELTVMRTQAQPHTVIIRLGRVPFMDITGILAFDEVVKRFQRHGANVIICELTPRVRYKLEKAGLLRHLGDGNVFADFSDALRLAAPHSASDIDSYTYWS